MANITLIGKTIMGYTVCETLGAGAFGTVYRVEKTNESGRYVRALKHITIPTEKQYYSVLNSMGGDESKAENYFAQMLDNIVSEIRILNELSEKGVPHIVRYYENDIMTSDSPKRYDIFILMEYLIPLEDYIMRNDFLVRDVAKLGLDILGGLQSCHANGVIHRDIKEDNIFVSDTGEYKLGDFGVSKVLRDSTKAESLKGTPNYLAPEVYLGKDGYTKSVDLYSLGIVLYRLLNYGRNPFMPPFPDQYFDHDEAHAFEERMSGKVPNLPSFGGAELGRVIVRAISDKTERYQSAAEFRRALEEAVSNTPADILDENTRVGIKPTRFSATEDDTYGTINKHLFNSITQDPPITDIKDDTGDTPTEKDKKSNKKGLILIIILAVIFLAAAVGAALIFLGRSGDTGQEPVTTEPPVVETVPAAAETEAVKTIEGITLDTSAMRTTYFLNETLEEANLALLIRYSDGTTETVSEGFTCSPKELTTAGTQTVTVTYEDKTVEFSVTVEKVVVETISINSKPNNTTYFINDTLDTTGLSLLVKRSNGTSQIVTTGFNCSPTKLTKDGIQKIQVSYGGKTAEFQITVKKVSVQSLSVKSNPTQTTYNINDSLNTSGLSVTVKYTDGSSETVKSGFTCSPTKLTKEGSQTVTVSYGGKTTSFTVQVKKAVTLTGISIASLPSKTTYKVGEKFNSSGLALLAKYSDGSTKRITQGFTCGTPDMSKAAKYNVGVSYEGYKVTFQITVEKAATQTPTQNTTSDSSGKCGTNANWEFKNNTLTISGKGAVSNYQTMPWSSYLKKITKVVIGNGITSICNNAFSGCTSLTSVTMPTTLTSIGDYAFNGCSSLSTVTIPHSVTSIGSGAFNECSSLTFVTLPNALTAIKQATFKGCTSLASVTIPDSVTSIGTEAFSDCTSLTEVTLPSSVTSVGANVFFRCSALKYITLKNRTTYPTDWDKSWKNRCYAEIVFSN